MIGHVGSRVGALVDGQLPPAEAERLWAHVHVCATCRAQVEREGWVKTQLAGLALCPPPRPVVSSLRGSLAGVGYGAPAGAEPPDFLSGPPGRRRMMTLAVLGAGSLGAAMVGVVALSVPAETPGVDRRGPATSLTRPTDSASPSPRGVAPVQSRLNLRAPSESR